MSEKVSAEMFAGTTWICLLCSVGKGDILLLRKALEQLRIVDKHRFYAELICWCLSVLGIAFLPTFLFLPTNPSIFPVIVPVSFSGKVC